MNRFMILALALVFGTVAAVQPAFATQPIAQKAGSRSCADCHFSSSGVIDNPPNLDPAKKSLWQKFISRDEPTGLEDSSGDFEFTGMPTASTNEEPRREAAAPDLGSLTPSSSEGNLDFDGLSRTDGAEGLNGNNVTDTGPGSPDSSLGLGGNEGGGSGNFSTQLMDDELIRIDLELKGLEEDIRTYRGLLETSRDSGEADSIKRTIFAYDAQRRALREQQRQLQAARQKAGSSGPGAPGSDGLDSDPTGADFASRALTRARENRLKAGAEGGSNPLSPEGAAVDVIRDVVTARDAVKDEEYLKAIEGLKDAELKERVDAIYSAYRLDPTMQKALDDLFAAIKQAGGPNARLSDVKTELERAEAEAKRKGLESDQLAKLFLANYPSRLPFEDYKRRMDVLSGFDKNYIDQNKTVNPELKSALEQAKKDLDAYRVAEKALVTDATNAGAAEQAEIKFHAHVKSMEKFLEIFDRLSDKGRNPAGIYVRAGAQSASTDTGPVLAPSDRGELADIAPDTSTVSPTAQKATPTEVAPVAQPSNNPDLLAKLAASLKSLNEAIDAKMKDVHTRLEKAWTTERHFYTGWLWSEDPRITALQQLSQKDFQYGYASPQNTFWEWPRQVANLYREGALGGIDVDAEPSLKDPLAKAKDAAVGALMIASLLNGYDGHNKNLENADFNAMMQQLNIDKSQNPPRFNLDVMRGKVRTDSEEIRTKKLDNLWTDQELTDAKALVNELIKSKDQGDAKTKLADVRRKFIWYQERMAKGYQSMAGGYALWMPVKDTPVYTLVVTFNWYMEKGLYHMAKVALDELR